MEAKGQEGRQAQESRPAQEDKQARAGRPAQEDKQAREGRPAREDGQAQKGADWNIRPYLAVGLTALLVIVLGISYYFLVDRYQDLTELVGKIWGILQPVLIGFVLAYLLSPIVRFEERHLLPFLEKRMGKRGNAQKMARGIGVLGAIVFVIVVVSILLQMVVPELYQSINGLVTSLPRQVRDFMDWLDRYVSSDSEAAGYLETILTEGADYVGEWARTELLPQGRTILTGLTSGVISVGRLLLNLVIGVIISIYVLLSKETFIGQAKKLVYAALPGRQANAVVHTVHKANEIFGGFISGKILDSVIIGLLCFVGLLALRMPYAVLVSVIVGVTNVIPFFGPYLGAVPSTALILLADPMKGLYFLIFILILQQVDGNIIGPKILGDSTGLSSFWVVFAILAGGGLFGIVGMIIGVPTFAVIYYVARNILNHILGHKGLPQDSGSYVFAERLDLDGNKLVCREEGTEPSPEKPKKKNRT